VVLLTTLSHGITTCQSAAGRCSHTHASRKSPTACLADETFWSLPVLGRGQGYDKELGLTMSDVRKEGERLTWNDVVASFRVVSAGQLLSLQRMVRYQELRDKPMWLKRADQPLALLFISHRWETLDHPDPSGRQLRAIQQFLRTICTCVEAMLVSKQERLRLAPSLAQEGILQAEEVARRIFGFGPFSDGFASARDCC
jgi:hypothetical protein